MVVVHEGEAHVFLGGISVHVSHIVIIVIVKRKRVIKMWVSSRGCTTGEVIGYMRDNQSATVFSVPGICRTWKT